jgi:serine/threonine-protein kinase
VNRSREPAGFVVSSTQLVGPGVYDGSGAIVTKPKKPWEDTWQATGETLGEGGHGIARLVRKAGESSGTLYVLKVLKDQVDPDRRARMHQEVAALETLDNPGIPKVVDSNARSFASAEPLYMVSDYIVGGTLKAASGTLPWSLAKALAFMNRLLDVVEYCHAPPRLVIHRDIKHDNIVLRAGKHDDPVLIDFGQSFNREEPTNDLTGSGQQLGNHFLALPELQTPGGTMARDPRSDITSCCAILFYLLTGKVPMTLLDEQRRKPHMREPGKAIIDALAPAERALVAQIFDIAFEYPIDGRWTSISLLREALNRSSADDESVIQSGFQAIRASMKASSEFARRERVGQLVQRVLKDLDLAIAEVVNAMKPELSFNKGPPGYDAAGLKGNVHLMVNSMTVNRSANLTFMSSVTPGDELQIDAVEGPAPRNPPTRVFAMPSQNYMPSPLRKSVIIFIQEWIKRKIVEGK